MNHLKPDKIVETISVLRQRIHERFPNAGLGEICEQLLQIAKTAEEKTKWFGQPVYWLRGLCILISLLIVAASVGTLFLVGDEIATSSNNPLTETTSEESSDDDASNTSGQPNSERIGLAEFVPLVEAGINDIVLIGAAIFFLITTETRYKRGRALEALHGLRSIAHIIDMHQLTKDPERITNKSYFMTTHSPRETMTKFELRRYLDYCSEMLSLTGKIAAVYVQDFNDSVALASVNEIETLCTGLSRKIWQKVSILQDDELEDQRPTRIQTET